MATTEIIESFLMECLSALALETTQPEIRARCEALLELWKEEGDAPHHAGGLPDAGLPLWAR